MLSPQCNDECICVVYEQTFLERELFIMSEVICLSYVLYYFVKCMYFPIHVNHVCLGTQDRFQKKKYSDN